MVTALTCGVDACLVQAGRSDSSFVTNVALDTADGWQTVTVTER